MHIYVSWCAERTRTSLKKLRQVRMLRHCNSAFVYGSSACLGLKLYAFMMLMCVKASLNLKVFDVCSLTCTK